MTRTAAQDSVIHLAAGMMAADLRVVLPTELRQWIILRLEDDTTPLTEAERAGLQEPLLAYCAAYHPRILDIVAHQFGETGVEEGPPAVAASRRPSAHYGVVPGRTTA